MDFIANELPPPPTPPEEVERRLALAEELARLEREEEERERQKAYKLAHPDEDEDEYEGKPRNRNLDAVRNGDDGSRRGSLLAPPPRSRQGSITIGGTERRGSYYDDGVTTRATVAMVTDDPEHKKNLKQSLSGVFNDETTEGVFDSTDASNHPSGELSSSSAGQKSAKAGGRGKSSTAAAGGGPGAAVASNGSAGGAAGGVASSAGGAAMAAGGVASNAGGAAMAAGGVAANAGGGGVVMSAGGVAANASAGGAAMSAGGVASNASAGGAMTGVAYKSSTGVENERLSVIDGSQAYFSGGVENGGGEASGVAAAIAGMQAALGNLPEDASPEQLQTVLADSEMDPSERDKLMKAFSLGVSAESRALMQQILASNSSQDEISSRVAALLAGTALSTSRGDKTSNLRGDVKMEQYDIGNLDLSARKRTDDFTMPDIPDIEIDGVRTGRDYSGSRRTGTAENGYDVSSGSVRRRKYYTASQGEDDSSSVNLRGASLDLMRAKRGSIKRQSELLRESRKKAQEREEERQRKRSYYRQIAGLRKAKVPMMVYSCGGFSRCFRVARYYDVEGPPVGVVFERPEDERRSLNPDL